ncbi:MAG: class I SAM-dependent methyltransferase [Dehalococcoidia bacterium]|jgi:ubiquinone/menaquinone biosynthesis C-methylase UbiE
MMNQIMAGSIGFDRAADTYDMTRALPQEVAQKLTDALLAEIRAAGADRILEVGVGTGRISRPLAERGVRVLGVDIAPRMLARLREQLGPQHTPPDLMLGDATWLPLLSASFRTVLVIHVLHLVSPWQTALAELRRVLGAGGVLIGDNTRSHTSGEWSVGSAKWRELLAARNLAPRVRPSADEIHSALRALGGSCRIVTFAEGEVRRTPEQNLERIRSRSHSWTWEIPDDLFAECLAEFEQWYRHHYGNMDKELVRHLSYSLEVWRFD